MLNFPDSPGANDTFGASNGVTYTFDGAKWIVSGSSIGPYLLLAGGTMTGPIQLAADPTTDPQAANKHYVDGSINLAGNYLGTWAVASNTPNISAGGSISNANYVATTVVAGTPETVPVGVPGIAGMSVANGDRVIWAAGLGVWQILRNAGVTLSAADARYYPLATNPSGYQTAANVTTALAPYAPLAAPVFTGDARAVTPTAGDNDTSIATTAFVQSAVGPYANNVGRNLLHNPLFNVQQRAGPWTTNLAYTADRWMLSINLDTVTATVQTLADADRTAIGDEAAVSAIQLAFTGSATAGAFSNFQQRIETVRRLGGKQVTVSFWARATAGTPRLGVITTQNFGTGGSPSAGVSTPFAATAALSPTWTRYVVSGTVPSTAGKTLGTAGNDWTGLHFGLSDQSNVWGLGLGVQSGTVQLWGVQLEFGTQATALAKRDPADELALCQRYFAVTFFEHWSIASAASQFFGSTVSLPVTMRATPTIAFFGQSYSNAASVAANATGTGYISVYATSAAAGTARVTTSLNASADL